MVILEETRRAQQQSMTVDAKTLTASSSSASDTPTNKPAPPKDLFDNSGGRGNRSDHGRGRG